MTDVFFKALSDAIAVRSEQIRQWELLHNAIRAAAMAHAASDREELARQLTEAADIEYALTGDCKAVSPLMDALGIDDEGRGEDDA